MLLTHSGSSAARFGFDKHTIHVILLLVLLAQCRALAFWWLFDGSNIWHPVGRRIVCFLLFCGTGEVGESTDGSVILIDLKSRACTIAISHVIRWCSRRVLI